MCTHVHVNTAHIERCSNASLEHSLTEPAPEPRVFDGHAQALHRDLHVIRLIVYSSGASHRIIQAIRSATTPPEPGRAALVAASYLSRRSDGAPLHALSGSAGDPNAEAWEEKKQDSFPTGICTYVHTHVYIYIYIHIYIYGYTYIHTYKYIYIYIYI